MKSLFHTWCKWMKFKNKSSSLKRIISLVQQAAASVSRFFFSCMNVKRWHVWWSWPVVAFIPVKTSAVTAVHWLWHSTKMTQMLCEVQNYGSQWKFIWLQVDRKTRWPLSSPNKTSHLKEMFLLLHRNIFMRARPVFFFYRTVFVVSLLSDRHGLIWEAALWFT